MQQFYGLQSNSLTIRHKDIYNSSVEFVQWKKKIFEHAVYEWFEMHNNIKKKNVIREKKEENTQ